ncbi:MAG TPA: nucleotidyltransferase family protein [Stellaceae bacterium]|nr:nucleotidyltransferase family protein [Stellaceae bacterium]
MRALSPPQWERLIRQARKSQLIARVALVCQERGWLPEIAERPRLHLEAALRQCAWRRRAARHEVDCLRRALKGANVSVILLKGAAYDLAELPLARGRLYSDIDIMVPRERIRDVEAALGAFGWFPQAYDPYDQRFYREWMHEIPPLQHIIRRTEMDIHHTITPPVSRYRVDAKRLWQAARPLEMEGRFFVLSPPDMVLHSIVHLFQEGEFEQGLRDVVDVADLVAHFGREPGFWQELIDRAEELRLGRLLYYAVQQIRRVFDRVLPADFVAAVDRFGPGGAFGSAMNWLFSMALVADLSGGGRLSTDLARRVLYLRGHCLRMPVRLMVPHLVRKAWRRNFAT